MSLRAVTVIIRFGPCGFGERAERELLHGVAVKFVAGAAIINHAKVVAGFLCHGTASGETLQLLRATIALAIIAKEREQTRRGDMRGARIYCSRLRIKLF